MKVSYMKLNFHIVSLVIAIIILTACLKVQATTRKFEVFLQFQTTEKRILEDNPLPGFLNEIAKTIPPVASHLYDNGDQPNKSIIEHMKTLLLTAQGEIYIAEFLRGLSRQNVFVF